MKKLLTILFVLTSFFASAQKLDSIRGAGFIWERGMFNKSLGIPTVCGVPKTNYTDSTKKAQIIYDSCAGKFYAYNPATESWAEPGGGGVSGVDSVTIVQTGCAFTFYTWKAGVSTAIGTLSQYSGVSAGTGLVARVSGTTFNVTSAVYAIDCVTYVTRDTTITLPAAGDTGRIDVIKVNTSSVTTFSQGTEGEALPLPSLSATELALSYILVTDTVIFIAPPVETPTWDYVGQNLTTHNPLSNVGIGGTPQGFKLQVFGNTALGVGNLNAETRFGPNIKIDYDGTGPRLFSSGRIGINGQSGLYIAGLGAVVDTTTYKPTVTDASGNVKRLSFWPVGSGGGGGSQTWQQTLTTGSTRTADVISESIGKYFRLYDRSSDSQTATTVQTDTTGFTVSHTETRGTTDKSAYITADVDGIELMYRDDEESKVSAIAADSTKSEMSTFFISDGGKNNKLGVAPNLSKGGFYYTSESGQYYFPRNTPSEGYTLSATAGGYLEWAPLPLDSTIYFESPLEVYTSGDSTKVRVNADTLLKWRYGILNTYTIDLRVDDYTMTEPGIYLVEHGTAGFSRNIDFPDPALFDGAEITIINADIEDNNTADYKGNKPYQNGSDTEWKTLPYTEMHKYVSIGGVWRGGKITL